MLSIIPFVSCQFQNNQLYKLNYNFKIICDQNNRNQFLSTFTFSLGIKDRKFQIQK